VVRRVADYYEKTSTYKEFGDHGALGALERLGGYRVVYRTVACIAEKPALSIPLCRAW
jgi:hypothetical protein